MGKQSKTGQPKKRRYNRSADGVMRTSVRYEFRFTREQMALLEAQTSPGWRVESVVGREADLAVEDLLSRLGRGEKS